MKEVILTLVTRHVTAGNYRFRQGCTRKYGRKYGTFFKEMQEAWLRHKKYGRDSRISAAFPLPKLTYL